MLTRMSSSRTGSWSRQDGPAGRRERASRKERLGLLQCFAAQCIALRRAEPGSPGIVIAKAGASRARMRVRVHGSECTHGDP
jgi:hypothetical protein